MALDIQVVDNPGREEWPALLARPVMETKKIRKIVKPILKEVQRKGDAALYKYAEEYDLVHLDELLVSHDELKDAIHKVDRQLQEAIQLAKKNIEAFHRAQAQLPQEVETMPGVRCRRRSVPIQKVGLYIPGGTAPLFSTVLMLGIPANLAGCEEIVLVTPPDKKGRVNPVILYTAHLVGIDKVVKVGGAQAIAALAFGTESVPKVDKIFGPGNQYVTAAKQIVSMKGTAIDMPAGPSEVAVMADETANPRFVAADLLSQAEHGIDSQVVLVSLSRKLVDEVMVELEQQINQLPRKEIAQRSIANSCVIILDNRQTAIDLINAYAPEHLIISTAYATDDAERIINAGSVFLGNFTPESAGDYASGTNHTLPTYGFARMYSGVSLDSYVKKITYQEISPAGLEKLGPAVEKMASAELLEGHKNAVAVRLDYLKEKNGTN